MAARTERSETARVLIVGGGVAALETALALRDLAGGLADVELYAPRSEFRYRPAAVGEPYGAAEVQRYDLDELARRCGAVFHLGAIVAVDAEERVARTRDGRAVPYDYLLVTPGARMLWAVPGAVTFWGVTDEGGVGAVIHRLRAGRLGRVVFTTPAGPSWSLPVYELPLLTARILARSGVEDAHLTVVTPEEAPLLVFGRTVAEQVGGLLEEAGIEIVAGSHPVEFDGELLRIAPGDPVPAEAVVSLPRLEGRRIDGIPRDPDGFVPVDRHCRVMELDRVFAAGDVTNFPVKHGGIAVQQADIVAASIAAELGADVQPADFDPVLRGVLWTGGEPLYLHGHLAGGHGETSRMEELPPGEHGDQKIVGGYLSDLIASDQGAQAAGGPGASGR
jgi:sulfide:quinone oxidoreductase